MSPLEIDTPHGPALAHLHAADDPRGALLLGHGAGGGVAARDLVAATQAALEEGVSVALVEQPYRVAGRKSPAPAHQLDAAWLAVVERDEALRSALLRARRRGERQRQRDPECGGPCTTHAGCLPASVGC